MSKGYTKKGGRSKRKNKTRKGGMFKKEMNISDINAVRKMIDCRGATLEVVSIDSLYGFVFLLTIPQDAEGDCIQFFGLVDKKPIYQIILKVALCYYGDKPNHTSYTGVIDDTEYTKSVMHWNDFYLEAKNQRKIFESFPFNPVTFGVGCCHMYYRVLDSNKIGYIEDITYDVVNETNVVVKTTNELLDNLYKIASVKPLENPSVKPLENPNKRARTEPQETITQETITQETITQETITQKTIKYIKKILTEHNDYHFAFIAMDAAMNHIDRNNYDILTLRNVRGNTYYPRCMEYANAIMILLFIKSNVLNIDAHSGNFLSSVKKGGLSSVKKEGLSSVKKEGIIDENNVKSWMIDMGRIHTVLGKDHEQIIYNNNNNSYDKLNGASLGDIYYSRFKRDWAYDYSYMMLIIDDWKINKQKINNTNIPNILHFINTFLIMMDYSINLIKYNRDTRKPPQSIRFADYITKTIAGDIDSMTKMVNILNIYLPGNPSLFFSQGTRYKNIFHANYVRIGIYDNIYNCMKIIDPTINHAGVSDDTNVVNITVNEQTSSKRKITNIYDEPFSNPFDNNVHEPFSNPFYDIVHEPLEKITPLVVANIIRKKKTLAKKTYSNENTSFSNEFRRKKDDNYFIRSQQDSSPKNLIISKMTKSQKNPKMTKSQKNPKITKSQNHKITKVAKSHGMLSRKNYNKT